MPDRRKTHAMTMELKTLCGQSGGVRTSIIKGRAIISTGPS